LEGPFGPFLFEQFILIVLMVIKTSWSSINNLWKRLASISRA